jgi:hypothetical protein
VTSKSFDRLFGGSSLTEKYTELGMLGGKEFARLAGTGLAT